MNGNTENFDWVSALAKCSPWAVFKELELGAKADVDARNLQRQPEDPIKYSLRKISDGHFSVILEGKRVPESVDFSLSGDVITVRTGLAGFTATLTLNNQRECRLKVKGEELTQWQVRKMALEGLFFGWSGVESEI